MLSSGCLGGASEPATGTPNPTAEPSAYDCDTANRPPSPGPDADPPGDAERYTYPDRPDSPSNEAVRSYVERYERAYRLNELRSRWGANLDHAGVFVEGTDTYDAPDGAVIARVEYAYGAGIEGNDGPIEVDSPTIYASYYVDDDVVLRAVEEGHQEDESRLIPDPIEQGQPVECF